MLPEKMSNVVTNYETQRRHNFRKQQSKIIWPRNFKTFLTNTHGKWIQGIASQQTRIFLKQKKIVWKYIVWIRYRQRETVRIGNGRTSWTLVHRAGNLMWKIGSIVTHWPLPKISRFHSLPDCLIPKRDHSMGTSLGWRINTETGWSYGWMMMISFGVERTVQHMSRKHAQSIKAIEVLSRCGFFSLRVSRCGLKEPNPSARCWYKHDPRKWPIDAVRVLMMQVRFTAHSGFFGEVHPEEHPVPKCTAAVTGRKTVAEEFVAGDDGHYNLIRQAKKMGYMGLALFVGYGWCVGHLYFDFFSIFLPIFSLHAGLMSVYSCSCSCCFVHATDTCSSSARMYNMFFFWRSFWYSSISFF